MAKFARPEDIPVTDVVCSRSREDNRALLLMLALGAVGAIRSDPQLIRTAERTVFSFDVLAYCKRELKDKDLEGVIAAGMELDDVARLIQSPQALVEACDRVEQMIHRLGIPRLG